MPGVEIVGHQLAIDLTKLPEHLTKTAQKLTKRIEFESFNEKGANGYVLIGKNKLLDRKVVVKFYYWGDGAHMEPRLLSMLASPHVLKVDDAAAIDQSYAYFIAPFCDAGDLDDVIEANQIGVRKAVDMIIDVATGASFIHSKGYIHRDLKPSNIFCDSNGRLLIGDFGSVVKKGDSGYAATVSRHSLLYRTPEEIQSSRAYPQGDVYQLGVVLYQLLGGQLPYEETAWLNSKELSAYEKLSKPDNQIYANSIVEQKILKGKLLDFDSLPAWCPPELIALIKKCCKISVAVRLDSPSTLIAKLNNLRASLSDWRLEPEPVLYRGKAKIRVIESGGKYSLEKMAAPGSAWRKVRSVQPCSLRDAVAAANLS
ncbi:MULTISPECIES: serine/threonine protein kinase [Brevundimonas]|uniref:serine/threonine protein kinase n=1 Tax=Brevundimonas TaxID=41275 RepID=UPI0025BAD899|nr:MULTISPECIES: protein kinase [Brevundimonas]